MARSHTDEHGCLIASSIGIAVPKDRNKWGYISEVHGHGMNQQEAADMLGTTLGLEIDLDKAWSEKEQVYKASGLIIRTPNATQIASQRAERSLDNNCCDCNVIV